jgi:hypothetical protein
MPRQRPLRDYGSTCEGTRFRRERLGGRSSAVRAPIRVGPHNMHVSDATATDAPGPNRGGRRSLCADACGPAQISNRRSQGPARDRLSSRGRVCSWRISSPAGEKIGRAPDEVFGTIGPACRMVKVSASIALEMLVEVEAGRIVTDGGSEPLLDGMAGRVDGGAGT